MEFLIVIGLLGIWISLGVWGFIHNWTKTSDFTISEIPLAVFVGLTMGPFSFIVGWVIHEPGIASKTIIKSKGD